MKKTILFYSQEEIKNFIKDVQPVHHEISPVMQDPKGYDYWVVSYQMPLSQKSYTAKWVYGSPETRNEMVEELVSLAKCSNDKYVTTFGEGTKHAIIKHIMSISIDWAYNLYTRGVHYYVCKDGSVDINVYGTALGDIKFPICEDLNISIGYHHNDWETDYYGDTIEVIHFSV